MSINRLGDLTRPTGEETTLDVAFPTPGSRPRPRLALTRLQVIIVAGLLFAAAVVWVVGSHLGASRVPAPAAPPSPAAGASLGDAASGAGGQGAGGARAASSGGAPPEQIVVSVVGDVAKPGLHTLPGDARVADALAAAGGEDNSGVLNLAARLADGEQVVVGGPAAGVIQPGSGSPEGGAQPGGAKPGEGQGLVSLNTATAAQLEDLPGVGEATAQAIIDYRESNGGFKSVDELMEVKGIGPVKFDGLAGQVGL